MKTNKKEPTTVLKGPNFFQGQSWEKLIIDLFVSIGIILSGNTNIIQINNFSPKNKK